jgi:hypothetical protein
MNPLRTSRTSNDEYSVDQINNYADNNVWIFFVLLAYPTVILIPNTNFIETKKEPYYVSSHFVFFQGHRQSSAPSFSKVAHREPMAQVFYE